MDTKASGVALMGWHEKTQRQLPWRAETDPYRIWVSETMLQQTRAAVAAQRYEEFLRAFPDIWALARADEEQVLRLWQGLGYYARARNMHKAARQICERHGGVFPQNEQQLRTLAGIGEYTACAVLSMAFGQQEAAIDANLARVISRVYALRGTPEENRALLRKLGGEWLCDCAPDRPGDFNRALMGFGAMICTAKRPNCQACPIAKWCAALFYGEQETLPEKKAKTPRKEEWRAVGVCIKEERVLVRRRPDKGMLAGMWEFPHYLMDEEAVSAENLRAALLQDGICTQAGGEEMLQTDFTFTHRRWRLRAWPMTIVAGCDVPMHRLVTADELMRLPFASVMEPYRQAALEIIGKKQ